MLGAAIKVFLGMDGKGFQAGLMMARKQVDQFATGIGNRLAGAFTLGSIGYQIKKVIDQGGRIKDMAAAMGMTTDEFQALDYAAKQTSTSVETIGKQITFVARAQKEALSGNEKTADAFKRLGISMDDLKSMSPKEIFLAIAKAVESGTVGFENIADLLMILGRNAKETLPAMQEGFGGLAERAKTLGVIIQEDVINRLDDMGDAIVDAQSKLDAFVASATIGLGEIVGWLSEKITRGGYALGALAAQEWGGETDWRDTLNELIAEDELKQAARDKQRAERITNARKRAEIAQTAMPEFENDKWAAQWLDEFAKADKEIKPITTKGEGGGVFSDALARIGGFTGRGSFADIRDPILNIEKTVTNIAQQFREANIRIFESYHL